jgi:hypothetical protein
MLRHIVLVELPSLHRRPAEKMMLLPIAPVSPPAFASYRSSSTKTKKWKEIMLRRTGWQFLSLTRKTEAFSVDPFTTNPAF